MSRKNILARQSQHRRVRWTSSPTKRSGRGGAHHEAGNGRRYRGKFPGTQYRRVNRRKFYGGGYTGNGNQTNGRRMSYMAYQRGGLNLRKGNGQTPNMAMPCEPGGGCPPGFYATIMRGSRGFGAVGSCYCTSIAQPRLPLR